MPKRASHESEEGRRWYRHLASAQGRVDAAQRRRDELVRDALAAGLSTHSVGAALGIDGATVWRRYSAKQAARR